MSKLNFGIILGNVNAVGKIAEFAKVAEDCGFDHLLLSDHYYSPEEPDLLDSWAVLAHLTGVTSTIKLGTCVTPITLRPVLHFAKFVSTLETISNGRLIVGVGAGWNEEEFRMFGEWRPGKERLEQFTEALQILLDAWSKPKCVFHGKFYKVDGCVVEPKPVQKPHPPVWFGGWSRKMLRNAGKFGNGWIPTGPRSGGAVESAEDYAKCVVEIREAMHLAGRPNEAFSFGCRFGLYATPRDHLLEIEKFMSAGLNCYQLGINVRNHTSDVVRTFADSVVACL